MKKVRRVSILLLIGVLLLFPGCSSGQPSTKYVPKYSSDQVLAVVKAQYPESYKYEGSGQYSAQPNQISVKFVGGTSHAWEATITSPENYFLSKGTGLNNIKKYFWEDDGALHDNYVP